MLNNFFSLKIVLLNVIMWKNIATYDNLLRRMRVACWMPKATNTHSQYVRHCFYTEPCLHGRGLVLRCTYIGCSVDTYSRQIEEKKKQLSMIFVI